MRLRHKSEDLRKLDITALLREIRLSGSFALQENGCGSIERILLQLFVFWRTDMPAPSRNDIYEAVIRKMVNQALKVQEQRFEEEHTSDADEALLEYLRACAGELGYAPRYKEVIGWRLLERRFGTWSMALQKAQLNPAAKCPVTKLPRIMKETEKQKELYRKKKAAKKEKNRKRIQEQVRKKKENVKV